MVDLLKVTLVNGIPTTGNGDVATINALMADGGLTTVGNMTDPANPATNATAATGIGIWKQISKSIQALVALWPTALGAGGGVKVDGSGIALPVSLSSVPAHDVFVLQRGHASSAAFTCGTNPYAAGDVVGGPLTFAAVGSGAVVINIVGCALEIDTGTIISGETSYRLYLYSVTPPSALADSSVWDLSSAGDRTAFLGYIDIGTVVDLGSTVYAQAAQTKIVKLSSGSVYGYLVTNGAYTPTARPFVVSLQTVEV